MGGTTKRRAGLASGLAAALCAASLALGGPAGAATGDLAYAGCITGETATGPTGSDACAAFADAAASGTDSGLDDVQAVAASADGSSFYAASTSDDAVASFTRDEEGGELTYAGCITGETQSGPTGTGACEEIPDAASFGANSGLDRLRALAVSDDGESLYAISDLDDAVVSFTRDTETGELTYTGCITGETESGPGTGTGACEAIDDAAGSGVNSGFDDVRSLTVTPDGKSLYAASYNDHAIASFTRDTETGELTYTGCITGETQSGPTGTGACEEIPDAASFGADSGLDNPRVTAASVASKSLYAASDDDDALSSFKRNKQTGALTYKGCITGEAESGPGGTDACKEIGAAASLGTNSGLDALRSPALSKDGKSLYAAGTSDAAVATFKRSKKSGKLAYKGCITGETQSGAGGTGACKEIGEAASNGANSGLDLVQSLAVNADGKSLYAVSALDDAVATFKRNKKNGKLSHKGCITGETESGPTGSDACEAIADAAATGANTGLDLLLSLAVSKDGKSLYTVSNGDDAVASFTRSP